MAAALPDMKCGECGAPMVLCTAGPRAGKLAGSRFWGCSRFPGVPTNGAGIEARRDAHAAFDPLWRSGAMKRGEAYRWLAGELGQSHVHIGESDIQTCERIVELSRKRLSEITCANCGEPGDLRHVEYDAMVDGPGYVISELLCAKCRRVTA